MCREADYFKSVLAALHGIYWDVLIEGRELFAFQSRQA